MKLGPPLHDRHDINRKAFVLNRKDLQVVGVDKQRAKEAMKAGIATKVRLNLPRT